MNAKEGTLLIPQVRVIDAGNYACVANTTGHPVKVSSPANLRVTSKWMAAVPDAVCLVLCLCVCILSSV